MTDLELMAKVVEERLQDLGTIVSHHHHYAKAIEMFVDNRLVLILYSTHIIYAVANMMDINSGRAAWEDVHFGRAAWEDFDSAVAEVRVTITRCHTETSVGS